jgi:predicted aconitase with swiveling domain
MITLHGRTVVPGYVEGEALVSPEPISGWGGIDPAAGRIIESRHVLNGQTFSGRILVFPSAKGSSGWAGFFQSTRLLGTAPLAMLITRISTKSALGRVVVLRGQGPTGSPGMGMASQLVFALDGAGLTGQVAVVTDGQLSGLVNKGIVVGEVSPEAARGGLLALVRDGDPIRIDVPPAERDRRRYSGRPASSRASAWSMRTNVSSKLVGSDQPSHGIVIDMITPTTAPAMVRTARSSAGRPARLPTASATTVIVRANSSSARARISGTVMVRLVVSRITSMSAPV